MKKRMFLFLLLVLLCLCAFSAAEEGKVTVRLGGLKGPTSMGMVKLLDDAEVYIRFEKCHLDFFQSTLDICF